MVLVRLAAVLEDEHELVLAAVEGTHACVVLGPDAQVLQLGISGLAGREQLPDVAPIHADEVECPVEAVAGEEPERTAQERGELGLVHLAHGHRELAMADGAEPADVAVDRHIVGRVGEDHCSTIVLHQRAVGRLVESATAMDAMGTEEPGNRRAGSPPAQPAAARHRDRVPVFPKLLRSADRSHPYQSR